MKNAIISIKNWTNIHPNEVVVLYFGEMQENRIQGLLELKNILEMEFNGVDGNVGLNNDWQANGHSEWPTLGKAIRDNQRIFAIVRVHSEQESSMLGTKIIPEKRIKVGKEKPDFNGNNLEILSTYKSMNIGYGCSALVDHVEKICSDYENISFKKVAIFGTHPKNSFFKCLSTMARDCNAQILPVIEACQKNGSFVNFLQSDYPNYPGTSKKTNVEIAYEQNLNYHQ